LISLGASCKFLILSWQTASLDSTFHCIDEQLMD
jgi:hypothetical protein